MAPSQVCDIEIRAWVVDEPGMNPYWAESIDDMIAGLSSWSITRRSATFESVAVSEIGRRSQMVRDLGIGGTSAIFQIRGTRHSTKEEFIMTGMGAAKISQYSLSTQLGSSSGLLAREVLIARSFFSANSSVTVIGSSSSTDTRTESVRGW